MLRITNNIILGIIVIAFIHGCDKELTIYENDVEIYLLEEYELVKNKCKINDSTIILRNKELINNNDIEYYILSDHKFVLTNNGIEKLKNMSDGVPFCLTVDREIIYSGFFKPGYSSSSCWHSVTIDPLSYRDNEIHVRLGYPGTLDDEPIEPDPRENEFLIGTFKKQGKLR